MLWNIVIVLNATELFTWKWLILCYMNFTQIKKNFKDFPKNIETSKNIKQSFLRKAKILEMYSEKD